MKKILGVVSLLIAVLMMTGICAYAEGEVQEAYVPESEFDSLLGQVTAVDDEYILVKSASDDVEYRLNIFEQSEIISDELMPVSPADIKEGMYAKAIFGKMMTMSIPPQLPLEMIIVSDDAAKLPLYSEIAYVTEENGQMVIDTKAPANRFYIADDTVIEPYKTRNIITKNDFSEGDRLLVYVDTLTASEPAIGTPSKIVVVENKLHEIAREPEVPEADELITRKDFCTVAFDILADKGLINEADGEGKVFTDVQDNKISALCNAGVINGTAEGVFSPDLPVNRQTAATIVWRIAEKYVNVMPPIGDFEFADKAEIADWALKGANFTFENSLLPFTKDGKFMPTEDITVAQAVMMFSEIFK